MVIKRFVSSFIVLLALSPTIFNTGILAIPVNHSSFYIDQNKINNKEKVDDREAEGLKGPVRRIQTETAKIIMQDGKPVEGPRTLLELTIYDLTGKKVDSEYHPNPNARPLTGKEAYKHDKNGNIIEMILVAPNGNILHKEVYTYEFDSIGNWIKMITSTVTSTLGRLAIQPTEVTYRTISYYLNEKLLAELNRAEAGSIRASISDQPTSPPNSQATITDPKTNLPNNKLSTTTEITKAPPIQIKEDADNKPNKDETTVEAIKRPDPIKEERTSDNSPATPPSNSSENEHVIAAIEGTTNVNSTTNSINNSGAKNSTETTPLTADSLKEKVLKLPLPEYPELAQRAKLTLPSQLKVKVEILIDETGKVLKARALSGHPFLIESAVKAAYQAEFRPTIISNKPVKVSGFIIYDFIPQ
jgi:outer membrane biosynthesis protein TonB